MLWPESTISNFGRMPHVASFQCYCNRSFRHPQSNKQAQSILGAIQKHLSTQSQDRMVLVLVWYWA